MQLFLRGRNHLKAAIALLVNKQSATFLLCKKSGFSSPPPTLLGSAVPKIKIHKTLGGKNPKPPGA